jgi:hypothetical protein
MTGDLGGQIAVGRAPDWRFLGQIALLVEHLTGESVYQIALLVKHMTGDLGGPDSSELVEHLNGVSECLIALSS